MQPLTTTPAGTHTDRFLEHPPSMGSLWYKGPALQKDNCGFFVSPLI